VLVGNLKRGDWAVGGSNRMDGFETEVLTTTIAFVDYIHTSASTYLTAIHIHVYMQFLLWAMCQIWERSEVCNRVMGSRVSDSGLGILLLYMEAMGKYL
jgi:hypothetical protein